MSFTKILYPKNFHFTKIPQPKKLHSEGDFHEHFLAKRASFLGGVLQKFPFKLCKLQFLRLFEGIGYQRQLCSMLKKKEDPVTGKFVELTRKILQGTSDPVPFLTRLNNDAEVNFADSPTPEAIQNITFECTSYIKFIMFYFPFSKTIEKEHRHRKFRSKGMHFRFESFF